MFPVSHRSEIKRVAEAMRTWEGDNLYEDFVRRNVLGGMNPKSGSAFQDPFAMRLPDDPMTGYFTRGDIEEQVMQEGSRLFLAREFAGKTWTLKAVEKRLASQDYLAVPIFLSNTADLIENDQNYQSGSTSPLSLSALPRFIFNAYWTKFIRAENEQSDKLPYYRNDPDWMKTLRFFYQRFKPRNPTLKTSYFEFMCWLESNQGDWENRPRSEHEQLQRMCEFVTLKIHNEFDGPQQKYKGVVILVDDFDAASPPVIKRVLDDLDLFYNLPLRDVQVKLFVKDSDFVRSKVYGLKAHTHGGLPIFEFPQWTANDLRKLLFLPRLRILGLDTPELYKASDPNPDSIWARDEKVNWFLNIPMFGQGMYERRHILHEVIKAALRVYSDADNKTDFDAPYHALCLTRGLLSGFAGSFRTKGVDPSDLDIKTITALFEAYWDC